MRLVPILLGSAHAAPQGFGQHEPLVRLDLHGNSLSVTAIIRTSVGGSEFAQQVTPARRRDKARKFIDGAHNVKRVIGWNAAVL